MGPNRTDSEWKCCFGLHVRIATVVIGFWHLFVNVVAFCLMAALIPSPATMRTSGDGFDDKVRHDEHLPTPLSKIDPFTCRDRHYQNKEAHANYVECILRIVISLMLVRGAIKYKPTHLIPFFCLQLFDFFITTLTSAGYLLYMTSSRSNGDKNQRLPLNDHWPTLSPDMMNLLMFLVFASIILLKAYAIGIVWRCYKFLSTRQINIRSSLPFVTPEIDVGAERDLNTLLPNYEQAIAQGMKQPPPQYYQVALTTATVNTPNGTETIAVSHLAPPAYTLADENMAAGQANAQPTNAPAPPQQPTLQPHANAPSHTINIASLNAQQQIQLQNYLNSG